jgi:hypothetical protein
VVDANTGNYHLQQIYLKKVVNYTVKAYFLGKISAFFSLFSGRG